MSKYIVYFMTLTILMCSFNVDAAVVRRAAFDFGSGKIKVQVADVDTDTRQILLSLYTEDAVVLLSEDAAHQPQSLLSDQIQEKAINAAQSLKQKALDLGATEFYGLATEAYRKAPNAHKLVDRYFSELAIPVKIISQIEEGQNAFRALIAETNLDQNEVISFDIGGGSFQVTYLDDDKNIQVYMAPFGRSTTKNAIITYVKGEDPATTLSPNPMSRGDWESALKYFDKTLPEVPEALALKLKKSDVQVIGISAHPEKLRNLSTYHLENIHNALEERLNKGDAELAASHKSPNSAVSELALVYSIMQKLQISTVNYIRTNGGATSALLISDEYWIENK